MASKKMVVVVAALLLVALMTLEAAPPAAAADCKAECVKFASSLGVSPEDCVKKCDAFAAQNQGGQPDYMNKKLDIP
ncbi:hypothetical protein BDA96_08G046800 [Sorghum bicolor]|uniref:Bifunctional inhibitor/plant lipid transfer protein/seed storage helical domain-containing protein n=2 Tax=Sorghum bicolor TaxID=4558 RepID=A0A921QE44_SORBI|nr:hypothetical protein BDA96_08G046800 [Sorghum bicolor]KXG23003.1 hypothetical protein SORBI_3008G043200 [Sorghum bicolor]